MDAETPALTFLADLVADAVRGYGTLGLAGVQLDDHFAQPVDLAPVGEDDPVLAMTGAALNLSTVVRTAIASLPGTNPVVLGLSPTTLSYALSSFNVDWRNWGSNALFDEFLPQLYRDSFSSFAPLLESTLAGLNDPAQPPFEAALGIGLRINGSGAATPWTDLNLMLNDCAVNGLPPALWYASGALELYPSELSAYWAASVETTAALQNP